MDDFSLFDPLETDKPESSTMARTTEHDPDTSNPEKKKKDEPINIEPEISLTLENEVIKFKPPKYTKNANFYQFTLRFMDWAHLSQSKPHYIHFLSCINDDNLYAKLHDVRIPFDKQTEPDFYIKLYCKAALPSKNEIQQKLLCIKQETSENIEKFAARVNLLMSQCSDNASINNTLGFNAFISGILDKNLKLKLYESGICNSFTEIVDKAKQLETANTLVTDTNRELDTPVVFAANATHHQPSHNADSTANQHRTSHNPRQNRTRRLCWTCGSDSHLSYTCPNNPAPNDTSYRQHNPHRFNQRAGNSYRQFTPRQGQFNQYRPRQQFFRAPRYGQTRFQH